MIMEILNNIWSALISENESLTKIIVNIFTFIELYISFNLFTTILKIPYTKKQMFQYIIILSIFGIINSLLIPAPFSMLLNYIVLFIFVKYLFKLNILQSILTIILPMLMFGLIHSLLLNPFLKLFNQTYETGFITPIYRISYLLFTYIIMFLIIVIIKHFDFKTIYNINLDKKIMRIIALNLILGIITLFVQAFMYFYYINTIPILFTLFNFGLLFAYFFFSFYSLVKAMKLDITTRDLENAESYNNSLTVLYDNVKGFKHDFDNIVNSIGGYIKLNDMEGLKKYYSSLEKDCTRVRNVQLLNPNIINNPAIYNLIVSKHKKATDLNIIINFEFFFDFNNLKMPIYEFSRILGILLDNAIEAAKDCEDKQINLLFRESQKQHVQIICIENTYIYKNIDTKKIFEKGVSGKENHSGIGLWEVNEIVKNNNNIVLNTTNDDKFFKQELQIYF